VDASVGNDASAGGGGDETGGAAGDGGGSSTGGSNDTGGVAANGGSAGAGGGGTGGAGTGGAGTGGAGTGGAGTGGSAGAAGCSSGTGGSADACLLIDNMEDGDTAILASCTRNGWWSASKDPVSGTQSFAMDPIAGGRCGSTRAAHTVTNLLGGYGASIAFDIFGGAPYDVSAYKGIVFAIMNTYGAATVNVRFPNVDTHPTGGRCGVDGASGCWDDWFKTVNVTSTWTAQTVLWSELHQTGWGYTTATFNKNIITVNFGIGTSSVDLWVDDIYFVP
jgi:hypothetical protein